VTEQQQHPLLLLLLPLLQLLLRLLLQLLWQGMHSSTAVLHLRTTSACAAAHPRHTASCSLHPPALRLPLLPP